MKEEQQCAEEPGASERPAAPETESQPEDFVQEEHIREERAKQAERQAEEEEMRRVRRIVREEIQRNYRPKSRWLRALALVLVGALLGSAGGYAMIRSGAVLPGLSGANGRATQAVEINLTENSTVENAVAAKATSSIVGVTTVVEQQSEFPFSYFGGEGGNSQASSVGSGVIISSDGYILTNSHVISNGASKDITVRLSNQEEYAAQLLWNDKTLDLAVIKIDAKGLTPIEIGDSSQIQVGDKAIAIGNPLGLDLQSTLTSGYVSGLGRTIQLSDGSIMDGLMQTDAAINSGNSGGALLNAKGQLIGINTAKPQSATGIGFAIPIDTAKPIIEKILAEGSYTPLYLGIVGMNVQLAQQMGATQLPSSSGVLVRDVYADSPIALAGVVSGDVITAIDSHPVDSMNSLKTALIQYKKGDTATVTFYHDGKEKQASVTFNDFVPTEQEKEDSSEGR
ncbi:MAG: trypsin-like peptidase domain-containing protein [Ndongobacter sp.]|nr:trypsin-like peptidase domain-containing protein [Ndongobacter sp.]